MLLYYMTTKQWAPVILRDRRLKISTIAELNDPFELLGASVGERKMRRALRILHAHWTRELGMICLTDNWHSPVMWAHYAEKHYGVCLGFDVSERPGLISKVDFAELSLTDIDTIVERRFQHVRPRWEDRPAVWERLLLTAESEDFRRTRDFNGNTKNQSVTTQLED